MDHVYKSQLQSYALKQNMDLPVYATERQGPAHSPRFRCKVTVCGQTFQSQEFFPTLKAAEHAAAKVALTSLTHLNPEGVDVAYKNLLQEIAQKENSLLPVYATSTSGPSHAPTFTSTVEFAGNVYKGEEAKTKKLAEMSAAKVAFMSIKCELEDVLNGTANSVKDINVAALPVATHPTNDVTLTTPVTNAMEMNIAGGDSSAMPQNPTNDGDESSSPCVEDSKKKLIMGSGYMSIPNGQHVVCRPWNPEMSLPEDAEMLFRDDRFVAYRMAKQ